MITLLLIWACIGFLMMLVGSRKGFGSVGLPLAYFFSLSLIHIPGAIIYVGSPEWQSMSLFTHVGFQQTVIGMAAFLVGVMIARYVTFATRGCAHDTEIRHKIDGVALTKRAQLYIVVGFLCFMSMRFLSHFPSASSVATVIASLMIVGICLRLWVAAASNDRSNWWRTVALLPFLPLLTLLKDGFLSFGTQWLLIVLGFIVNQARQARFRFVAIAPIVGFVGLSAFVNYMAARSEYRQVVWYENAGLGTRIEQVARMFDNFQWLDLSSARQRRAIDERLNQNMLVGLAAERLASGQEDYAEGATIGNIILALIPRVLWPSKPSVGGGKDIVHQFTGLQFANGTSVGTGQVLEFYVNFGMWGVIGGFLLWGWLLGKMDVRAMECLNEGDQSGFLLWFLTGLAMVQPGGNLREILVSAASAVIVSKGIYYIWAGQRSGIATDAAMLRSRLTSRID